MSSFYDAPDSRLDFVFPEVRSDPADRARRPAVAGRGRRAALLGGAVAAVAALLLAGERREPVPVAQVAPAPVVVAAAEPPPLRPRPPRRRPPSPRPRSSGRPRWRGYRRRRRDPSRPAVTVSTRNMPLAPVLRTVATPPPRPAQPLAATALVATPELDAGRPMRRPASAGAAPAVAKPAVAAE